MRKSKLVKAVLATALICVMPLSTVVYGADISEDDFVKGIEEVHMLNNISESDECMTFADICGYNKLIKYEDEELTVTYEYDEMGQRVGKTVNGSQFIYEYDEGKLVREEYDGNTVEYIYEYASIMPMGFYYNESLYTYIKNLAGYIIGITSTDNGSAKYVFDDNWVLKEISIDDGNTCGNIYKAALNNHFLGIGCYYDSELEIYYNGRYYSPKTGTFLGSICNTEIIGKRNVQKRAGVDYDMEADLWAHDLLNSSEYGKPITNYTKEWYSGMDTVEIVARLIYGENCGENRSAEREAIAWLLLYRMDRPSDFGSGLLGVATKESEFSAINPAENGDGNTEIARNPQNNLQWHNATYLACLITLTQNKTDVYEVIGKPMYYTDQVYFLSYTSVKKYTRLSGSGSNLTMQTVDGAVKVKDVAIISLGTYSNSADIYSDYISSQSLGTRNVFYNIQ